MTRPAQPGPIRVGLIRGAFLNPFEMQTFERMQPEVAFEAYHIRINRFAVDGIKLPLRRMRCIDDLAARLSPRLGYYFDLALQATCGLDYYHFGLDKALARQQIAHTMETFNVFSYQALLAKRRHGTKLVVTVFENRPFAAERFAAKRRMKYQVLHGADLFIVPTPRAGECLVLEGADPARIRVIPTGIDLERFRPRPAPAGERARLNLFPGDFVFLSVAVLRWEKGVHEILQAFAKLVREQPSAPLRLVFAGRGPEQELLRTRSLQLGVADRVIFTRFPYERMHHAYNLADVCLLNSAPRKGWLEQFGFVLPEALASGVPVIATQSGSIPEVVGLALHAAMRELWTNAQERRRLSAAGRARAEREYDAGKNSLRFREAYESVL